MNMGNMLLQEDEEKEEEQGPPDYRKKITEKTEAKVIVPDWAK